MPIETYALQVDLGIDDEIKDRAADDDLETGPVTSNTEIPHVFGDPDGTSLSTPYLLSQTPIADVYRTPANSLNSLGSTLTTQPLRTNKSKGFAGSTGSLNRLGALLSEGGDAAEDDDWSRSVLLAADMTDKNSGT